MNRFFILLILLLASCADEAIDMDVWETQMATALKATNIQLSHINTSKTVNGVYSGGEVYLELEIFDSKVLKEISHNARILERKCNEIKNIVMNLPEVSELPAFNDLRIKMIATHGVWIFKFKKENTLAFRVH